MKVNSRAKDLVSEQMDVSLDDTRKEMGEIIAGFEKRNTKRSVAYATAIGLAVLIFTDGTVLPENTAEFQEMINDVTGVLQRWKDYAVAKPGERSH